MECKEKEVQSNISCSAVPNAHRLLVSYKLNTLANFFRIFKYSPFHSFKKDKPLRLSIPRHFLLFASSPCTSTSTHRSKVQSGKTNTDWRRIRRSA